MTDRLLKLLGAEMNAQDNRGTQRVLFVVQQRRKQYGSSDMTSERERKEIDNIDIGDLCERCYNLYHEDEDFPEECDDCSDETFVFFDWEWEFAFDNGAAFFFTAAACDRHIEANRHHYGKSARSYGISAWRNEELGGVMAHLSALATPDGKPISTYRI